MGKECSETNLEVNRYKPPTLGECKGQKGRLRSRPLLFSMSIALELQSAAFTHQTSSGRPALAVPWMASS